MKFIENIISNLMKIGLTKYESMVYLTLLENQEITAYEISKRSGVPQSKIYGTVGSLIEKGIALPNGTDPTKYAALPLDKFLENYKTETETTIDYLKDNIKNIKTDNTTDYIWHFNGSEQIYTKIKSMLGNVQKSIYLTAWAKEYDFFYKDLFAASEKNIDVVSVLYGTTQKTVGKIYYHEMHDMHKIAAKYGRWFSLVIDNKESLFASFNEQNSCAVWTQNIAFMLVTESFIMHDIYIAEIYLKHKEELNKEFGENLEKLRQNIHIG
ncbi:TrmB family transcriptional regulator [Sporomusa acidovorans]|uniref:Transcription regulator TrmB N-terminal domain-containing protein n=1 Tax=Sporomusa acidovorans (strain ATCC 49682 / DSM 3132 / Mol) TaxID=1123286 RepID=A0ABZ3J525_SPOA4|nr:helix-turn-helix domain-containing protein [Sporomusa acidovorans]OZC15544.1 sugar-specific transcriptional regulator TrmB [Sporomusa acidovorans DSM 3132]SDE17682.1 Sugar-specific transcriptional regulator TrmB [Sporomusa acidovorans]